MRLATSLPLLGALFVQGLDFSFLRDAVEAAQQHLGMKPAPTRIAIIGAGAGGSSAGKLFGMPLGCSTDPFCSLLDTKSKGASRN